MTRKEYIARDGRMNYYRPLSKEWWLDWLLRSEQYYIKCYMRALRSEEYYTYEHPCKILCYKWKRRKNILGSRLGFFIPAGCFGPDLKIWHYGSVIVNPESRIGPSCDIHGCCCIGNRGASQASPIIGAHVNIGQNAQILGGITIADGVKIGAGAVVVKSVDKTDVSVAGVPASIIA